MISIEEYCILLRITIYLIFDKIMQRLLRQRPFSMIARSTVPEYRPEVNDTKCKNWLARLTSLSSKPASKVYLSQLSGLIAYYNKTVTETAKVTQIKFSPSISQHGKARSSQADSSIKFRAATNSFLTRNTIWIRCSTMYSRKTQKPSMTLYA